MRIGYLAYTPMPSHKASGVNIMKMCDALAELGHEVRLFNPRISAGVSAAELATFYGIRDRISLCRLPRPRNRLKGLVRYTRSYRRAMKAIRSDLLYIRDHGAKVYIPCRLRIDKVFEAHLLHVDNPHIQALERDPALRQFVVISSALREEYDRFYPSLASILSVHHDGADPGITSCEQASLRLPLIADKLNAAYIGNLYPGKGMELIQQLLPLAEFCHFHILGGQGEELEHWRRRCGAAENITFDGFLSPAAVEQLRSQFDCLLAPFQTRVMGGPDTNVAQWMSPLKIFEYMASGKPIIASDLPVIREVLENEVNAFLCRPDNPADWAAALRRIRNESKLSAEIAECALTRLRNHYSWHQRAKRILQTISIPS
ncbi:MAG: glycosyltransferase family 4 protein [Cyanobacteriota bacterium]